VKTADELIAEAILRAGTGEFDSDSWRQGLDILVGELNAHPWVTPEGLERMYGEFVDALWNRLRVSKYLTETPHVLDTGIDQPLVVLGMPRTGTTVASCLLDQDPSRRSLLNWEAQDTVPPAASGSARTDPRCLAKLEQQRGLAEAIIESGRSVPHWEWANGPTECIFVQAQDFKAFYWDAMMPTPVYSDWLLECDMTSAYEYLKKVLQILQSTNPGSWSLKMPSHATHIETLLKTFPDVQIVWAHRDPYKALGSLCSAQRGGKASVCGGQADLEYVGRNSVKQIMAHIDRATTARQRIGDDRFFDLHYANLMRDPVAEMHRLYEWAGDSLDSELEMSMRQWLKDNPQGKFGRHSYDIEEYGLSKSALEPLFTPYVDAFGIEPEA